ncbi:MAG: ABC transporter ATP-binding protein [Alphaproteobacteria bacterium]|nr:ABC transporter ATP-binding protein [Alphaproteobacteria bacterium]MDP6815620.1 ABC transporter ATP-binding protein [Alphaproteobacteria bacterium]
MTPALEVRDLCRSFGALHVARNINLALAPGARQALIGPNGAGKTMLVNLITGALKPDSGAVFVRGEEITDLGQAARVKKGLARTYQINQLFRELTVLENIALSVAERRRRGANLLQPFSRNRETVDEAAQLIETLRLGDDMLKPIRELPYGRQRLVEIAITLGQRPEVLLLDEPAAGVPSTESHIILEALDALPDNIAILIIEHDMEVVFRFAEQVTVLVGGAVLVEGPPAAIAKDEGVRAVYLGEHEHG